MLALRHPRDIDLHTIPQLARRHATGLAAATLVLSVLGFAVAVVSAVRVGDSSATAMHGTARLLTRETLVSVACQILPYGLVGAVLLDRRPDLPFGWLLSLAALTQVVFLTVAGGSAIAIESGHGGRLASFGLSAGALMFVPTAIQGIVNVRFPSGRPTGRWGRILSRLLTWGTVVTLAGSVPALAARYAAAPRGGEQEVLDQQVGGVGSVFEALVPVIILLGLVAGIGVIVRAVRARGRERQQLRWRASGVVLSLCLFPLAVTERLPELVTSLDAVVFVTTLAIPVLRYRLWSIDTILRRSAVYGVVTAGVVATYVVAIGLTTTVASTRVSASLAAGAAALALVPLHRLARGFVDRVFYGNRADPYRVLSEVGAQLDAVTVPGSTVQTVVTAVAESLRLPYVAIHRPESETVTASHGGPGWADTGRAATAEQTDEALGADGDLMLGAHGEPAANIRLERWPLTLQGFPVGELVAAPRRGEDAFDERDRRILGDLAHHIGPAVRADSLMGDLVTARQHLVTAREEERRRLRRDLHDGLGPLLTALGLNLDAAEAQLSHDPARARELLHSAKRVSAQVIEDLRELVHGLRPPTLDELGLVGALRLQTERLARDGGLALTVHADSLVPLPAAVEVAAYRTVVEAVTNVVRHGTASRCHVELDIEPGAFTVTITDDGPGRSPWSAGVGIAAMGERAAELGGALRAGPTATGGRVSVTYPLAGTLPGATSSAPAAAVTEAARP